MNLFGFANYKAILDSLTTVIDGVAYTDHVTTEELRSVLRRAQKSIAYARMQQKTGRIFDDAMANFLEFERIFGVPAPTVNTSDPDTIDIIPKQLGRFTQEQKDYLYAMGEWINQNHAASAANRRIFQQENSIKGINALRKKYGFNDAQMDMLEQLFALPEWQRIRQQVRYHPGIIQSIEGWLDDLGAEHFDEVKMMLSQSSTVSEFSRKLFTRIKQI